MLPQLNALVVQCRSNISCSCSRLERAILQAAARGILLAAALASSDLAALASSDLAGSRSRLKRSCLKLLSPRAILLTAASQNALTKLACESWSDRAQTFDFRCRIPDVTIPAIRIVGIKFQRSQPRTLRPIRARRIQFSANSWKNLRLHSGLLQNVEIVWRTDSPADHFDPHGDPYAAHRTKFNFAQWNQACTSKGFANVNSREVGGEAKDPS